MLAAAQQTSAAAKALPGAGQPGAPVQAQPQLRNSTSKTEAGRGAMAARTLMFFKGCPCALGCTVLLKGAPRHVLASVKKVMEVCSHVHPTVLTHYIQSGGYEVLVFTHFLSFRKNPEILASEARRGLCARIAMVL